MEEEDPAVPVVFEFEQQQLPGGLMSAGSTMPDSGSTMTDAVPVPALNEERALVLYKPVDAHLLLSPAQSNVSFRVSSDLIHGLKNQAFQSGNQMRIEDKSSVSSNCLAVVPWVPNQGSVTGSGYPEVQSKVSQEPMEAEQIESVSMEVEEERDQAEQASIDGGGAGGEGFHQWQQHCLTPQLPANPSTPIMWSW